MLIWDISDPVNPKQLSHWKTGGGGTHRNSYPGGNYAYLSAGMPGYKPMDDATLKARLVKMRESNGKDDDLHPLTILKSGLPRDELIRELTPSRDRSFYRLSNEALSDVKIANALINALSFREK